MKVTIEVDCTPAEARAFLGLPDITGLNAQVTEALQKKIEANVALLQPDELLKSWTAFGGQALEQFRKLMTAAAGAGPGARDQAER
jgi:hypothetical protein